MVFNVRCQLVYGSRWLQQTSHWHIAMPSVEASTPSTKPALDLSKRGSFLHRIRPVSKIRRSELVALTRLANNLWLVEHGKYHLHINMILCIAPHIGYRCKPRTVSEGIAVAEQRRCSRRIGAPVITHSEGSVFRPCHRSS